MFKTLKNIWRVEDLRKRVLFTLFVLIIYRIGSFVPVPGVNKDVFEATNSAGKEVLDFSIRSRVERSSSSRYLRSGSCLTSLRLS